MTIRTISILDVSYLSTRPPDPFAFSRIPNLSKSHGSLRVSGSAAFDARECRGRFHLVRVCLRCVEQCEGLFVNQGCAPVCKATVKVNSIGAILDKLSLVPSAYLSYSLRRKKDGMYPCRCSPSGQVQADTDSDPTSHIIQESNRVYSVQVLPGDAASRSPESPAQVEKAFWEFLHGFRVGGEFVYR